MEMVVNAGEIRCSLGKGAPSSAIPWEEATTRGGSPGCSPTYGTPQKRHGGAEQKPGFFLRTYLLKQRCTHHRKLASTGNDKKHATLLREVCYCVVLHSLSVWLSDPRTSTEGGGSILLTRKADRQETRDQEEGSGAARPRADWKKKAKK